MQLWGIKCATFVSSLFSAAFTLLVNTHAMRASLPLAHSSDQPGLMEGSGLVNGTWRSTCAFTEVGKRERMEVIVTNKAPTTVSCVRITLISRRFWPCRIFYTSPPRARSHRHKMQISFPYAPDMFSLNANKSQAIIKGLAANTH